MSTILRKYIDIINESQLDPVGKEDDYGNLVSKQIDEVSPKGWEGTVKAMKKHPEIDNPWALAHYMKGKGYKSHKHEDGVAEKWGEPTTVSPQEKGKYTGRSLADLRKAYGALKDTGPHHKGSPEYGRMRELAFAIRAKTGWGKV